AVFVSAAVPVPAPAVVPVVPAVYLEVYELVPYFEAAVVVGLSVVSVPVVPAPAVVPVVAPVVPAVYLELYELVPYFEAAVVVVGLVSVVVLVSVPVASSCCPAWTFWTFS